MVTQWPVLIIHADLNSNGIEDHGEKVTFYSELNYDAPGLHNYFYYHEGYFIAFFDLVDDGPSVMAGGSPGNGISEDDFDIRVSMIRPDDSMLEQEIKVTAVNVPPVFVDRPQLTFTTNTDGSRLASITNVNYVDPGIRDVITPSVIWGDGDETFANGDGRLQRTYAAPPDLSAAAVYPVTVQLTDDDTGRGKYRFESMVVGWNNDDDDGNEVSDHLDAGPSPLEDDLVMLDLSNILRGYVTNADGTVYLQYSYDDTAAHYEQTTPIRIWLQRDKGGTTWQSVDSWHGWALPAGVTTVWIEGTKIGTDTVYVSWLPNNSNANSIPLGQVAVATLGSAPTGNLTLTNHDSTVVTEADEEDASKTKLPACGCKATLSITDLNLIATAGKLKLSYSSEFIEIRNLSGEVIPSGYVIGDNSFVVLGVAQGVATISLDYIGPAGNQSLDRISLTVPNPHFDIDLRVAAYIPLSKGRPIEFRNNPSAQPGANELRWLPEPGAITNPKPYYATNDRENPGDPGTSKIAVNATVNSSDIGNLENGGDAFSVEKTFTYRAIVRRDGDGTYWADGSSVQVKEQTPGTSEDREDYFGHQSDVRITGTAGYPYIWAPIVANIDFSINFFLDRRPDCSVDVYISGWRDGFPAYEVMVDGNVVHGYMEPGETGPNPANLSTRTAVAGFIKIKPQ